MIEWKKSSEIPPPENVRLLCCEDGGYSLFVAEIWMDRDGWKNVRIYAASRFDDYSIHDIAWWAEWNTPVR